MSPSPFPRVPLTVAALVAQLPLQGPRCGKARLMGLTKGFLHSYKSQQVLGIYRKQHTPEGNCLQSDVTSLVSLGFGPNPWARQLFLVVLLLLLSGLPYIEKAPLFLNLSPVSQCAASWV